MSNGRVIEFPALTSPVPEYGRRLHKREAATINRRFGTCYSTESYIVAATADGWSAFFVGASVKSIVLVSKCVPGDYAVLSSAVPVGGRAITPYESSVLRAYGVPCSLLWWLIPDGKGGAVRQGDESSGVRLTLRSATPADCCCWACGAVGCSVRDRGGR